MNPLYKKSWTTCTPQNASSKFTKKKYGLRSELFYDYFQAGAIEDTGNFDFQMWAGLVEARRDLERR